MYENLVRPTSKGQVTIPKVIRDQLQIDANTFLSVGIENKKIVFQPVNIQTKQKGRIYTDEELAEFIREDKLSKENAAFLKKLFKKLEG